MVTAFVYGTTNDRHTGARTQGCAPGTIVLNVMLVATRGTNMSRGFWLNATIFLFSHDVGPRLAIRRETLTSDRSDSG